jgi:hypothetical protein
MLFMVIERFRDGDPVPVYRRFREKGRMLPDGVSYVGSWIEQDLARCFQLMECADVAMLEPWVAAWRDLADFEIVPVITSQEAAKAVEPPPDR